jgi:hypothetical protein
MCPPKEIRKESPTADAEQNQHNCHIEAAPRDAYTAPDSQQAFQCSGGRPTMTHPKTPLTQPDQNAGGPSGSIIDMPTMNTMIQPAIDSVAAILILSFHHAIPSYPFQ